MIAEQAQPDVSSASQKIVTEVQIAVSDIERSLDACLILAVELRNCGQPPGEHADPEHAAIDWPALLQ